MIPKVIHYCWFGNNKNKLMRKCIKSWKKYCPDYKIVEWNEKNFLIYKDLVIMYERHIVNKNGLCFRLCKIMDYI